jgi:hypothetical protein
MCSSTSWYSPRASYSVAGRATSTCAPSRGAKRSVMAFMRNSAQRTCACSSFRVKYRCPEPGREKLLISPCTQTCAKLPSSSRAPAR